MAAKTSPDLNELFDAWDKTTGGGRDADKARQLCHDYIAAHPEDFAEFDALIDRKDLTPEDVRDAMVYLVDVAREKIQHFTEAGMTAEARKLEDHKLLVDVWIMSRIDPQNIGGEAHITVRRPNG
jgi:uncharacterized protein (DUF433 family)